MRGIAGLRGMAGCREGKAGGRVAWWGATLRGQDKSACHIRRKPLMRLGFCVAGGSVACVPHDIGQGFQGFGVAGADLVFRRGRP